MGWRTVVQPDGRYSVWSTVVDAFIATDGTMEEVESMYLEKTLADVRRTIQHDLSRPECYADFVEEAESRARFEAGLDDDDDDDE